jgi:hypothetical protein
MAEDLQKKWEERITRAKAVREKWAQDFRVDEGRAYFEGRNNPGYPPEEWINVNKIAAHLQAQLPLLYGIDPYFYMKLKKSYSPDLAKVKEFELQGKARQGMLNYLKGELDLKSKARMSIQDAHFEYGVLKVRRASDLEKHAHAGEPILNEAGKPQKDPQTGEPMVYPDTLPVNERYEIMRLHPGDFLVDEEAGPLEDSWAWCAHRTHMTKAEAMKNPAYKKKAVKSIKGKARTSEEDKKKGIVERALDRFSGKKEETEYVDIWEIYDLKAKEFLTLAEDAEELLIDPKHCPPGIEKHPFSVLRFVLRDSSPYPIPPVYNALDPQKEYSLTRSRRVTHRKRFNRKYEVVVAKLMDEDQDLSKIENGDDGTLIRVQSPGAVNPIADAPLDQSEWQEMAMLDRDFIEVFGTGGNSRGVADADSATEASILDKRLEVREGDRLSMVTDWIIVAARKLDQLVQYNIDKDEAVKVTGPQGEFWQVVRKTDYDEIAGEYEYSVNLGASQARLPEIERAQWIAFLSQVVLPMPHILTAPSFLKRMAEMFHIEDEAALQELQMLGQKIMAGMMPMPGGQGGGPSDNPVAAVLGAAMGPTGGNANGGGSPMAQ